MDLEEAIQTIKETIRDNVNIGTAKIYSISWSEDAGSKKLKNYLGFFYISWVTEDNSAYMQCFSKNDTPFSQETVFLRPKSGNAKRIS